MSVHEIARGGAPCPADPPAHAARDLLGPGGTARIVLDTAGHGEQVYTLRLTRAGKLILTK